MQVIGGGGGGGSPHKKKIFIALWCILSIFSILWEGIYGCLYKGIFVRQYSLALYSYHILIYYAILFVKKKNKVLVLQTNIHLTRLMPQF